MGAGVTEGEASLQHPASPLVAAVSWSLTLCSSPPADVWAGELGGQQHLRGRLWGRGPQTRAGQLQVRLTPPSGVMWLLIVPVAPPVWPASTCVTPAGRRRRPGSIWPRDPVVFCSSFNSETSPLTRWALPLDLYIAVDFCRPRDVGVFRRLSLDDVFPTSHDI